MSNEYLRPSAQFVGTLVVNTTSATQSLFTRGVQFQWVVDWSSVFKNQQRVLPRDAVYKAVHRFSGDRLTGPILGVGYTAADVYNSPDTCTFLVSTNIAPGAAAGISYPTATNQTALSPAINVVEWTNPIGGLTIAAEVVFLGTRSALPNTFICRNPEAFQTLTITMIATDVNYSVAEESALQAFYGTHIFTFELLN